MGAGPVIGGTPSHLSAGEAVVSGVRSARPVVALFAGLALMVVAWAAATPLGQAADEPAHYIKALAAGRGDVHGATPDVANVDALATLVKQQRSTESRAAQARALNFIAEASGAFTLPRALVPARGCFPNFFTRADTTDRAHCVTIPSRGPGEQARFTTYVEAYPPYLYALPGLAMRAAGDDHPDAAYWLGRGAVAALALVLLGLALLLLWDPTAGAVSLVGAMVATTPMSLWSFSVLNTSGLEIAGATCWTAGLVRLVRRSPSPPWVWAATAAGGAVLATARPSGPVFVVFAPLCVALVFGFPQLVAAVRSGSRRAVVAGLVVGVALAAAVFWQRYMPGYSIDADTVLDSVSSALDGLPEALREAVGRFAGDYFIPTWVAVAWAVLLALLVAAAARRQPRLVLVAVVSMVAIAAYATSYLTSGFDEFYGRYALPALVVLPLCAGAALAERGAQLAESARRRLVVAFTLTTAAIHLLAWWLEARRLAVGTDGPLYFLGEAGWTPPGGWAFWVLAMLAGAALYVTAALTRAAIPSALSSQPTPALRR
jgi:hypothetical protein